MDWTKRCAHFVTAEVIDTALANPEPTGELTAACANCGESLKVAFRVTHLDHQQSPEGRE
jgi:hypothetical protein